MDKEEHARKTEDEAGMNGSALAPSPDRREAAESAARRSEPEVTRFATIGAAGVDRLVEAFYARMDSLPEASAIRAMHAADLSATKEVLKRYLCEWMGGPSLYSQERGHPRLRMRHFRFKIDVAERDAWLLCMQGALAEVVADRELRDALFRDFAKLADWVRNQPGNPHDAIAAKGPAPS